MDGKEQGKMTDLGVVLGIVGLGVGAYSTLSMAVRFGLELALRALGSMVGGGAAVGWILFFMPAIVFGWFGYWAGSKMKF